MTRTVNEWVFGYTDPVLANISAYIADYNEKFPNKPINPNIVPNAFLQLQVYHMQPRY
jgi:hypothetical protein